MRRLSFVFLAALFVGAIAPSAFASKPSDEDLCTNIPGFQSRVPHGLVLRISIPSGALICVEPDPVAPKHP